MHNPDSMTRRVALLCLADLDALSQRYVAEVRRLPGYLTTVVGDDELYRTARQMLGTVFRLIAGESTTEELARVSAEVGRRRATQGVPLDSLLRAVRMDFRFLWEAMRAYVDDADMAEFSTEVVAIWETVETHTVNVHSGYMDEVARTSREVELERAFLLRHLLAGTGDARLRAEAADALGLRIDGTFVVAAGSPDHARRFRDLVTERLPGTPVDTLDGREFCIIDTSAGLDPKSVAALEAMPAGISPPAKGVEQLPAMWAVACELGRLVESGTAAATLERSWDKLMAARLGPVAESFARERLAPLDVLGRHDRANLLQAVRVFAGNGSVTDTAIALYCHRNTVLNRLRRFTQLTGLDPAVPRQAALIQLALAADTAATDPDGGRTD